MKYVKLYINYMKISILIVEDEPIMNKVIKYGLEKSGKYKVDTAYDGKEAVKILGEKTYSVIILDFHLPYLNGSEILHEIKKRGINSKVIFLTGNGLIHSKIEAFKLGADEYITKPFDMDELLIRIQKVLNCNPN